MEQNPLLVLGAFAAFGVLAYLVYAFQEAGLANPNDTTRITIGEMATNHCLPLEKPVRAVLIRQSGNVHRDLGVFASPDEALAEVAKSFRRAKIDAVHVFSNTAFRYSVRRLHHSHGGKSEGKKLGGAVLTSV